MSIEVEKLVFRSRQIDVVLDDGTPAWPLRIHPAVQQHFEALTAEVAALRPEAAEMAVLRAQAERAGENPKSLLAGMVRKIERLTDALETERAVSSQRIAELRREVAVTEKTARRDAFQTAVKLAREPYERCARCGPAEAVDVLCEVVGRLESQASLMEMQVARMTG